MLALDVLVKDYLNYCEYLKGLSKKTIKAYKTDLKQFVCGMQETWYTKQSVESYIKGLYLMYKPRTAKRKIACLKAFFTYLETEDLLAENPFHKIKLKHREPVALPRTIPADVLRRLLQSVYADASDLSASEFHRKNAVRNIAVLEMLFSTGMRVYELCNLKKNDVDLKSGMVRVNGKGLKERYIYITNKTVIAALRHYFKLFENTIMSRNCFFVNDRGEPLSTQSVRNMIVKYEKVIQSSVHITPHMFRHTIATMLLEEDVDIRYIQELLGHSSIVTTQIYTHISMNAQKRILTRKHPRNKIHIE